VLTAFECECDSVGNVLAGSQTVGGPEPVISYTYNQRRAPAHPRRAARRHDL